MGVAAGWQRHVVPAATRHHRGSALTVQHPMLVGSAIRSCLLGMAARRHHRIVDVAESRQILVVHVPSGLQDLQAGVAAVLKCLTLCFAAGWQHQQEAASGS